MDCRTVTGLVIVAVVVGVFVYDVLAYALGGTEATISDAMLSTAALYRAFPYVTVFGLGVLVGHVFLPIRVQR